MSQSSIKKESQSILITINYCQSNGYEKEAHDLEEHIRLKYQDLSLVFQKDQDSKRTGRFEVKVFNKAHRLSEKGIQVHNKSTGKNGCPSENWDKCDQTLEQAFVNLSKS